VERGSTLKGMSHIPLLVTEESKKVEKKREMVENDTGFNRQSQGKVKKRDKALSTQLGTTVHNSRESTRTPSPVELARKEG